MEPANIVPLRSSSPPQLVVEGGCQVGSEAEGLGNFGGFSVGVSCLPAGFADSTDSPSSHRPSSPTEKPATDQPNCSFNHPVKQSQPISSVNPGSGRSQSDLEGQDHQVESCVHLTNGYSERDQSSGNHITFAVRACPPREETGFTDFTVFTEQAAHPWCCGFAPSGGTEKWDNRTIGATRLGEQVYDPGWEGFVDSEPGPLCIYRAEGKDCTMLRHCEKKDAAPVLPSQDQQQPQETAAACHLPSEKPHVGEGESSRESLRHGRHGVNSLQTIEVLDNAESEDRGDPEHPISAVPQMFSACESLSEDLASSCEDLSFEGPSADLEPNVSSLGSEEQTDWDQTEDEEEGLGNYSKLDAFVNGSVANLTQAKTEGGFQHCGPSATQETSATSSQTQSGTPTNGNFADLTGCRLQHDGGDPGHSPTAGTGVLILGTLPPSDSFADFCAAPTQDHEEESWAEFKDQKVQEGGATWIQAREQVSSLQTDGRNDEDKRGQYGITGKDSCQASLSCCVQQLLLAGFPEVEGPDVEAKEEVPSLSALLSTKHLPESGEEETPVPCPTTQWIQKGMWWLHQDLHSAAGLKFHWRGSHASMTLLRCLGVDTKNTGMMEPTKDFVPAVSSHEHKTVSAQAPPGLQDTSAPSADSVQDALSSSQLNWSSRGLSSSQDGMSPRRVPHCWSRK